MSLAGVAVALTLPSSAIEQCSTITLFTSHYSSWDSSGRRNFVRVAESNRDTMLVGKGYFQSRSSWNGELRVSTHVLGFQVPVFQGVVARAELHLHLGELVSMATVERYSVRSLSRADVRIEMHRLLAVQGLYDDLAVGNVYGEGVMRMGVSRQVIPLNEDFQDLLTAAQGRLIAVEGLITSLDSDPWNAQYMIPERATLVLTLAGTNSPVVLRQPEEQVIPIGSAAQFSVLACGQAPMSYQWFFEGSPLPGATNASLLIPEVAGENAGRYWVVASNNRGTISSQTNLLKLREQMPILVGSPSDQSWWAGNDEARLTGRFYGAPRPVLQWHKDGVPLVGATNTVLLFPYSTPADSGAYTLVASNYLGVVNSNTGRVEVVPFIFGGPHDGNALLGSEFWLSSGYFSPLPLLRMQWYFNGTPLPGETNMTLGFTAEMERAGDYYAIGENQFGAVTSRVARVEVFRKAPDFVVPLEGAATFIMDQTNAQLTVQAQAGPPAVYYWYKDGQLIAGEHGNVLSFPTITWSSAGQYSVTASNEMGVVSSGPAKVEVRAAEVGGWVSSGGSVGGTTVLRSTYSGVYPASFQWLFDGTPLAGQTNAFLVLYNSQATQSGTYALVAENRYGTVTGHVAQVTISAATPEISGYYASSPARAGSAALVHAFAPEGAFKAAQWYHNGVPVPGATNVSLMLFNVTTQQSGLYEIRLTSLSGNTITNGSRAELHVVEESPLDDWRWLAPVPQANPFRGVAAGDGRRVAVAGRGTVAVSTDGSTWRHHQMDPQFEPRGIAFGNGVFVLAGEYVFTDWMTCAVLFTSTDGESWVPRAVRNFGKISCIAFGNNRFVAIGPDFFDNPPAELLISEDGLNWERRTLRPEAALSRPRALTFGGGRFVLVSETPLMDPSIGKYRGIFTSTDGLAWDLANGDDMFTGYMAVTHGNSGFVAVGRGMATVSADGVNWTPGNLMLTDYWLTSVAAGNGVYVTFGPELRAFTSNNGLLWRAISHPGTHDVNAVTFAGNSFTAVTDAGRILVSSNGQDWMDQTAGPDTDLFGLTVGPEGWVAVGDGAILSSTNGVQWHSTPSSVRLRRVIYANGQYVAAGRSGTILTSSNAYTWTRVLSAGQGYLEALAYGNGRYVAGGEEGLMYGSADGLNWSRLPTITPGDIESLTFGNGMFVAVGGFFTNVGAVSTILTSTDGLNWAPQAEGFWFGKRSRSVTFGDGKYVIVGNDGLVAVSTNGVNWQTGFAHNENLRAVTFTQGRFVAVGNDGSVVSSADGVEWQRHISPATMNLRDIVASGGAVLAVGSNGAILQSGSLAPLFTANLMSEGLDLELSGGMARKYRLQESSDLRQWQDVRVFTNYNGRMRFLDSKAHENSARFYRVLPVQ